MQNKSSTSDKEPGLGATIRDDMRKGGFWKGVKRDFKDLKEFYIDDERKKKLTEMGRFKRFFLVNAWILKSMFMKLTTVRRLLLIIGLVFLFTLQINNNNSSTNNHIIAGIIFLLIIMLELKDKLLARSELQAGRSVQRALMPEQNPHIPGWDLWLFSKPANDVGGDLLDFMQINKKRYSAALGDVSGKGLGAALFMAKLQSILRALAPDFTSLSLLGNKLNMIFHRDSTPNSFASLVYLEFETGNPAVRILNAGHLPPLVVRYNIINEMPKGDLAIGLVADTKYNEQTITLKPGETLVVFSDGLTEARNAKEEFYGEDLLKKEILQNSSLSARDLGEHLLSQVEQYTSGEKWSDDLSLLILRNK